MAVTVNGVLSFEANLGLGQIDSQIKSLEQKLQSLTRTSEKEAKSIENLVRNTTSAIAAYASIATATNFIGDIVRVRGEFQKLEISFRVMLKSKEAADKLLEQAVELAAKTPFTLQDVGTAAKQLLAYGFAAGSIVDNIKTLGDVSAGVGAPLGDIVYLFGTLRTQGRAFTKDITQFTSRGIPIIEELAKQFGVTKEEVFGMVEAGKVGFPEVEQAFKSMTSEGGLFFNLMQEQSKSLTGQISNLKDAYFQMLNEIGKSNEGLFSEAIQGATALVKNYQTVLDVLELLVISYGSYRAAIIVNSIAANVVKGYTVAETLRYQAMLLSERAMKILNTTMLSNPIVGITTLIATLTAAFVIFGKRVSQAEKAQKAMNDVQTEAAKIVAVEKDKLQQLLIIAKDETKSKEDRFSAIKKINGISPEYLGNLTLENIKTKEGIDFIKKYIELLDKKALAQAVSSKKQKIFEENIDLQNKIDQLRNAGATEKKPGVFASTKQFILNTELAKTAINLKENNDLIDTLNIKYGDALTAELLGEGKKQEAKKRTIALIEQEINDEKERQKKQTNRQDFNEIQKNIDQLTKELEAITGKAAAKAGAKASTDALNDAKQRAEDIKNLFEEISQAESDARLSALSKDDAEIERINKKYDDLRKKAEELKAGDGAVGRVEAARSADLGVNVQKKQVEEYKKTIEDQRKLFNDFEEYKLQLGTDKAKELTGDLTKDYSSFIDFLKAQLKLASQDQTLRGSLKKEFLTTTIVDVEKEKRQKEIKEEAERFTEILEMSQTFAGRKKQIEENYQKDVDLLRKSYKGKDIEERSAILKEARDQELTDLENSAVRQSHVYQLLNEDIIRFTREQLKQRLKDLKDILEKDLTLTPEMKENLQGYIDQLEELIKKTSEGAKTAKEFAKLSEEFAQISTIFSDVSGALEGINDGLADTFSVLGEITGVASSAFDSISKFASGDILGGIASGIKAIAGIFSIGKKSRESQRKAEAEIAEFQARILAGEIEINQQYRERERSQVRLNKLKLQGLAQENKLLEAQKKTVLDQYNSLFAQLQKESFVVGETTKKYGGVLGIGRKTKVVEITQTLAGKTFDELNKLFSQGQLTGKAKDLFELLNKIKQEGVDIDKLLAENAEAAKQIFTGTTADSITDSIVDGFKNGLNSASDFADTFEDLMRNAILNALKFQALEGPLNEFYDQFAASSESDGILTAEEIRILKEKFAGIIQDANDKFQELQNITDINLSAGSSTGNSLKGAIKGITEQQAELLAGQFGGLRLTAIEQLNIAKNQLDGINAIQVNTGLAATRLLLVYDRLYHYFEIVGVKIR